MNEKGRSKPCWSLADVCEGRYVGLKYHNKGRCGQRVRNVWARYWSAGMVGLGAEFQVSVVHSPYARFGLDTHSTRNPVKDRTNVSKCLFVFVIKVVIHISLETCVFAAGGPSAPPRRHAPAREIHSALLGPPALALQRIASFFSWLATWTPQSLQPQVHIALHTSNGMP